MAITLEQLHALAEARLSGVPEGEELDALSAALIDLGVKASVTALDVEWVERAIEAARAAGASTAQLEETVALVSGLGVHSLMVSAPLILRAHVSVAALSQNKTRSLLGGFTEMSGNTLRTSVIPSGVEGPSRSADPSTRPPAERAGGPSTPLGARGDALPLVSANPLDAARQALWNEKVGTDLFWSSFEREVPGFLDALLRLAPDTFRAFFDYCALPWRSGTVRAWTKELISMACDATPAHRFSPGFRVHLSNAITLGVGASAIRGALKLAAACPPHSGV